MLRKMLFAAAFVAGLSACTQMDKYESQVTDWEPVYCYKSLAAVQCYREPKVSDKLRLVNYYGPSPSRYDAPETPPSVELKAPEMVNYWVKDAEPVPQPMPHGDLADRPWLTQQGRDEQRATQAMSTLKVSDTGTLALLRRIAYSAPAAGPDNAAGETPVKLELPLPDGDIK